MPNKYQLEAAMAAFDAINAADPRHIAVGEEQLPYELVYGRRMSAALTAFAPAAAPALQLAARAQHLERWAIPREDYPQDRVGYLKWRNDLKAYHAERAGKLLVALDFPAATIERVQFLLQKKQLRKDADTQTLEDVICLVFLAHYAQDFAKRHPEEKVVSILQKTWKKMSPEGHAAALQLDLPPNVRMLVEKALADA